MCSHGDVRLVGGGSDLQGRLEFCAGGEWTTICSNGWDEREASVVCRQLGHSGDGKFVLERKGGWLLKRVFAIYCHFATTVMLQSHVRCILTYSCICTHFI